MFYSLQSENKGLAKVRLEIVPPRSGVIPNSVAFKERRKTQTESQRDFGTATWNGVREDIAAGEVA